MNEDKAINKQTIYWIDIMKGILIILMVLSHTHIIAREYIFLFHMPVFFMISGYCWNIKHSNGMKKIWAYVKNKTIRLYIPFVLLNVVYILLFNLMLKIGLFTSDASFLNIVINPPEKQHIYTMMSMRQIFIAIGRALVFAGGANELCNPTWFLASLWLASMFHAFVEYILLKINRLEAHQFSRTNALLILFIASLFVSWFFDKVNTGLLGIIERAPCTYSCYLAGVILREIVKPALPSKQYNVRKIIQINTKMPIRFIRVMVSFSVLLGIYLFGFRIRLSSCGMENPLILLICMSFGWYLVMDISIILGENGVLSFIGRNTMPILLFHLTVFKLVSYIWLLVTNQQMILLASFPVVYSSPEWMRFVYGFTGTIIPLAIYIPYKKVKSAVQTKIRGK